MHIPWSRNTIFPSFHSLCFTEGGSKSPRSLWGDNLGVTRCVGLITLQALVETGLCLPLVRGRPRVFCEFWKDKGWTRAFSDPT